MSAHTSLEFSLVAAVARNSVIGVGGDLPWHIPEDLAFFKSVTLGKPMLMGRKTWESLPGALPNRSHVVLSRSLPLHAVPESSGCVVRSELEALEALSNFAMQLNVREVSVIGGGVIYKEWIDRANRLYLTHVDAAPDGDTWFPSFDPAAWQASTLSSRSASEGDGKKGAKPAFKIVRYERRL